MSEIPANIACAEYLAIAVILRRLLKMQHLCQRCSIYVMKHPWPLPISAILASALLLGACLGTPGTTVTSAGEVVYSAGAKQDTVTATLAVPPEAVFKSIIRVIAEAEGAEVIQRDDDTRMVEVAFEGRSINAQATEYGDVGTLLFLWADAGETGLTGNAVAMSTIETISKDLNASFELVEN
jgi:hypothetical protein